jgi:hypothetical protein
LFDLATDEVVLEEEGLEGFEGCVYGEIGIHEGREVVLEVEISQVMVGLEFEGVAEEILEGDSFVYRFEDGLDELFELHGDGF